MWLLPHRLLSSNLGGRGGGNLRGHSARAGEARDFGQAGNEAAGKAHFSEVAWSAEGLSPAFTSLTSDSEDKDAVQKARPPNGHMRPLC